MQKLLPLIAIVAIFPMFSKSQVKADVQQAPAQNSRMDLDVSPILQLGPADPMPSLGIHPMRAIHQGPSREEKIAAAAHWLKVAAGAKPVLMEIPDTGYTIHLTGDPQTLQELKDAVAHAKPFNHRFQWRVDDGISRVGLPTDHQLRSLGQLGQRPRE